jgi:hypothetical protein
LSVSKAVFAADGWTVAGWFNLTTIANNMHLFSQGTALGLGNQRLIVPVSTQTLRIIVNGSLSITSSTVLSTSAWYHVGVTSDGITAKIYLNGVLDTSGALATSYAGAQFQLGSSSSPTAFLNGSLASWDVYNRVLPASAFANMFNSNNGVAFANYGSIAG